MPMTRALMTQMIRMKTFSIFGGMASRKAPIRMCRALRTP